MLNDLHERLSHRFKISFVFSVAAVSQFEEKLMNTPDCDLGTQRSLYESLGDGCVHMNSFSKALEYYHLMLEVCLFRH